MHARCVCRRHHLQFRRALLLHHQPHLHQYVLTQRRLCLCCVWIAPSSFVPSAGQLPCERCWAPLPHPAPQPSGQAFHYRVCEVVQWFEEGGQGA